MKHWKLLLYSFAITCIVASCNKDEDPIETGPDGTLVKAGYFEGTISGTSKNGSPIKESFKYEYKNLAEGEEFFVEDGQTNLYIFRQSTESGSPFLDMSLVRDGNNLKPADISYSVSFRFKKNISANQALVVNARPLFMDMKGYTSELARQINSDIYHFSKGSNPANNSSNAISYYATEMDGLSLWKFYGYQGNASYGVYYRQDNGRLYQIYDYSKDEYIKSGSLFDIYNKLKFVKDASAKIRVFYDVDTNRSVANVIPDTPADDLKITNYKFDSVNGVLSFDYVLTISAHREYLNGKNSTLNALTITGKFFSGDRVYERVE